MNKNGISALLLALLLWAPAGVFAVGTDAPTKFTNKGTIANTRHNLTQRPPDTPAGMTKLDSTKMDSSRNQYYDICVYCHTPHGANTSVATVDGETSIQGAPLWNRSYVESTYQMYDQLGTSSLTPGSILPNRPGPNSLTCLSCHDGQVAIDSIINMPGPGGYDKGRETNGQSSTLNEWYTKMGGNATNVHAKLAPGALTCQVCHAEGTLDNNPGGSIIATDFDSFYIGTDLKNDHPVGVNFNENPAEFNIANLKTSKGTSKYIDTDGDNKMEPFEVRTYNGRVECASCHDPHGVPVGGVRGTGIAFIRTFLRVQNDNSDLCLTCHIK